jgi:hypothetical protein
VISLPSNYNYSSYLVSVPVSKPVQARVKAYSDSDGMIIESYARPVSNHPVLVCRARRAGSLGSNWLQGIFLGCIFCPIDIEQQVKP